MKLRTIYYINVQYNNLTLISKVFCLIAVEVTRFKFI